eukprot:392851_1
MADDNNNDNNSNNNNNNNDDDDSSYNNDQYGTMIMTDDTINGYKQNGYKQNNHNNQNSTNYDADDDNYGTMIMTSDPKEEEINSDNLVSIFDGQTLINSVITLPDNPTKQELLNINETLKQLFAHDLQKLQDYYQANIAFVSKKISKLD